MNKTKPTTTSHTLGPWNNFGNEYIGAGKVPWDKDWKCITSMAAPKEEDSDNPITEQEQIANAKLITAAPELLSACEYALSVLLEGGLYDVSERIAVDKLAAAIKLSKEGNDAKD